MGELQNFDHKHLLIHAALNNPPKTEEDLNKWLLSVISAANMKVLLEPKSIKCNTKGNIGVTGLACIETSHLSAHCWEEGVPPFMKADLYSCKNFDVSKILETLSVFDPIYIGYTLIDRNKEINVLENKLIQIKTISSFLSNDDKILFSKAKRLSKEKLTSDHRRVLNEYSRLSRIYSASYQQRVLKRKEEHKSIIAVIKNRAKDRNLDFDLTTDWYETESNKAKQKWPKLLIHPKNNRGQYFWMATVDRKDSLKGYIKDNCRIIPHGLNLAKSNWTLDEYEELYQLMKEEFNDEKEPQTS